MLLVFLPEWFSHISSKFLDFFSSKRKLWTLQGRGSLWQVSLLDARCSLGFPWHCCVCSSRLLPWDPNGKHSNSYGKHHVITKTPFPMIQTRYTQLAVICTFLLRFRKAVFPQDADLFVFCGIPTIFTISGSKKAHGNLTIYLYTIFSSFMPLLQ